MSRRLSANKFAYQLHNLLTRPASPAFWLSGRVSAAPTVSTGAGGTVDAARRVFVALAAST
jgi:hypothetical protein